MTHPGDTHNSVTDSWAFADAAVDTTARLRAPHPGLAFRAGRGISSRLYRREIEIRDGLVLLGPFYDRDLAGRAGQVAAGSTDPEIAVTVALIRGALRAHRAGQPVADPHPLPASGADTRTADLNWIIRVAAGFAAAEKTHGHLTAAEA
ncbi:DUF6545 domain-containing protein [Pseudonocardia sp. 73-21]|uniref:DUF6545 domain-containing protein n=1 Tax=Pseudonocardia sp. 73-21 TaxID=1895809 RepID=UPI0009662715|nr:DUF6545 domain-containing protein [Pseudonocardia sp. 73-21]OJY43419.1 MAG: hypothetical protein BGP03_10530 [Pseudonocardia sp. 73-21]